MRLWILIYTLLIACCYGDWNRDFDRQTEALLEHLIEPRVATYKKQYRAFQKIREKCLVDLALKGSILKLDPSEKEIFYKLEDNLFVKKRANNNLKEAYVWEISTLLGSRSCIVPAFPLYIGGKFVILQNQESFFIREKGSFSPSKAVLKKVSTESYWEGHLQAYLFGIGDLVGRNIGVSKEGRIRFFDAEGSFSYNDYPGYPKVINKEGFCTGFFAHSLAWPHFEESLTQKDVEELQKLIDSWQHLEENIQIYLAFRQAPLNLEKMLYRLEKIRSFPLEKGKSFKDFYAHLFPRVGEGLEELKQMVSKLLDKKVSSGEAIVWSRKGMSYFAFPEKQRKEMRQWIATYIQEEVAR